MTKLGAFISRFLLLLGISLLMTFGSVISASTDLVDAVEFGIPYSGDSDYRKTTVWGQPAPFIVDHPYNSGKGKIDSKDIFRTDYFLLSSMLWFIALGVMYLVVSAGIWTLKRSSRLDRAD